MEQGVITAQTTTFGNRQLKYRVWVAVEVPGIIEHHYFKGAAEAVAAVGGGLGDGANAAGLEHLEDREWIEFYDDRGCDLDEMVDEWRERGGSETLQDVLDRMGE